jgi:hypothetical protein
VLHLRLEMQLLTSDWKSYAADDSTGEA